MTAALPKTGIIVPCWDALRADTQAFETFIAAARVFESVIVLSQNHTRAQPLSACERLPRSFVAGPRLLSRARLSRLCARLCFFDGVRLVPLDVPPPPASKDARIGFVVSNGYGLGHVMRTRVLAQGLAPYAAQDFMSFSSAFVKGAFYLPSAQYLKLQGDDGYAYTRQAVLRFLESAGPTHVVYDGNVLPDGLLAALSLHPHIHLTWLRRGMWPANTAPEYMAAQALADLVVQPGDLAESFDDGPSWKRRNDFAPPGAYLKTLPLRPVTAQAAPLLLPDAPRALIMLGAAQTAQTAMLACIVDHVKVCGFAPVIAHWPMAQDSPPRIDGAQTIEHMPLSPHYASFDVIISAAGYNSFHELIAGGYPVVFIPQEDAGRDNQLARANWAAQQGLAQICRHDELHRLALLIPQARCHQTRIDWFDDWAGLAAAMSIGEPAPSKDIRPGGPASPRRIKAMHRRWRGPKDGDTRFVLALNVPPEKFLRKTPAANDVVITNCIDPVLLRRAGCRYLWLNDGISPAGFRRQFLTWLKIWRPRRLVRL